MEEIVIEGWKGKSGVGITQNLDGFRITEIRKEKETGDIKESVHFVKEKDYNTIRNIINLLDKSIVYTSKYIARKLIRLKDLDEIEEMTEEQLMSALWGGKYRTKYYFPLLYYPIKILEAKGIIKYGGRGNIIRLQ